MTKIRNIIQINSGYTSYVDLYEDYYDIVKNHGRMERYKPIAAHRKVFEKITNALNPLDRRFYFLSGSYGTGKSHLLLMLANYFASPSDLPEIEAFFKNYETAQNEVLLKPGEILKEKKASSLKEARKSGSFLVALCRYSLNLDFEGALLRALEEALQKDESSILFDSHYREALRRIHDWESRKSETRFYSDFESAINRLSPDWTINDLIDGLESYDEKALIEFKNCFQSVTDSEFTYKKDNLRDIISDFLKNPEFKGRYKGIVFLYDEFGAAIDANLANYTTLLDFAQYCANSTLDKGGTVIFIGTGHKAFRNHGQIGDLNAETLEARVSEIGLQTQGMEDIIAAIVQPKKESREWKEQVETQSGKFTWFSSECNRLRLFNWLPAPKIKNNIIQNIYPMHPLATFALLRLAGEAGSDNRSVFKFFAPEFETGEEGWRNVQPYSYPWFIENNEILDQKKLILYTSDLLVDYFKESLKATNNRLLDRVKTAIINYEATLRQLKAYLAQNSREQLFDEADELMLRILKVMLVNEIVSTQDVPIPNTAQNIEFALEYVATDEKKQVENRLKLLCDANILFNNHDVYELMRGDRKDVQRIVEQFKSNPENRPTNILQTFLELTPFRNDELYLEAKEYNGHYNEDKRLKVIFATPQMLTENRTVDGLSLPYFDALEKERLTTTGATNSYEGSVVYVFCGNDNDINVAKRAVTHNNQSRVSIAIPKNPIEIYDAIITLMAFDSDWYKKQSQSFSPYEKAEEKRIRDEATKTLNKAKTDYFTNSKVYWFGKNGIEIQVQDNKRHDAANRMIQDLFGNKRNTFPHDVFNKIHINLSGQVRKIFKEAGDLLCNLTQPIKVNWTWPDNRGGNKYLRKCFVDHQVLRILHTEGDIRYLEAEKNKTKFVTAIPVYVKLLDDLTMLEGKGQKNLLQFIKPYFEEYGQGEISITLLLLLARRYFGDSLRFKLEPNNLVDIQFTNTEDMLDLVQGQSPSAVIMFESVSVEDKTYFAKLVQIFSSQSKPAGQVYTISEAYEAAVKWWDSLPIIARSLPFYSDEDKPLAEILSQAKIKDPFAFVKYDLIEKLDQVPGEKLTNEIIDAIDSRLRAFKDSANSVLLNTEEQILAQVADIFGSLSHLDVDIQEALKNWHRGLSISQKDSIGTYHNNDSKPLVKFTSYANIRELLFETLPQAYSLGSVNSWTTNSVQTLAQRIRSGKHHIETNAPQISQLDLKYSNDLSQDGNQVFYKGELKVQTNTEDGQGIIYYTNDGSDPTSSQQRHQLMPGDILTITGIRKIRLVVSDGKDNYSAVRTIEAIDQLEKFKIVRPTQTTALDETITFVFPTTQDSAKITLLSLFRELKKSGIYKDNELHQTVLEALKDINS